MRTGEVASGELGVVSEGRLSLDLSTAGGGGRGGARFAPGEAGLRGGEVGDTVRSFGRGEAGEPGLSFRSAGEDGLPLLLATGGDVMGLSAVPFAPCPIISKRARNEWTDAIAGSPASDEFWTSDILTDIITELGSCPCLVKCLCANTTPLYAESKIIQYRAARSLFRKKYKPRSVSELTPTRDRRYTSNGHE